MEALVLHGPAAVLAMITTSVLDVCHIRQPLHGAALVARR